MSTARDNLLVILHQVRSPDNLGAVARLMANFGYHQLLLSEPRTYTFQAAEKLGVGADPVLARMRVTLDLRSALGEAVCAFATTSRREVMGRCALSPEDAAVRLAQESARGRVALVFGGEKRGLSDDEISLCQEIVRIPTESFQPSINLAQSAAILLYLLSRTGVAELPHQPSGAQLRLVESLEQAMRDALLQSGFLNPQAPDAILRELERSLLRGRLSQREAEMWIAAFQHLRRSNKAGPA